MIILNRQYSNSLRDKIQLLREFKPIFKDMIKRGESSDLWVLEIRELRRELKRLSIIPDYSVIYPRSKDGEFCFDSFFFDF